MEVSRGLYTVILVGTNTEDGYIYTQIQGQRDANIYLYEDKNTKIICSGMCCKGDNAMRKVFNSYANDKELMIKVKGYINNEIKMKVEEIKIDAPYDDVASYSITFISV